MLYLKEEEIRRYKKKDGVENKISFHIGEVRNNTLSFSRSVSNKCLRFEPKLTFYPTLALA